MRAFPRGWKLVIIGIWAPLALAGCFTECGNPTSTFRAGVDPGFHRGPPSVNFVLTVTVEPPDSDETGDSVIFEWDEAPLLATGAPALTEKPDGLTYAFGVAGDDPTSHMFEFPCVEGEYEIRLKVYYERLAHEDAERDFVIEVECSDNLGPDAGPPSSYSAEIEVAYSELDSPGTVTIDEPTIAEGVVFYRIQDDVGSNPVLRSYQTPGAMSTLEPGSDYSILNLTFMTGPFGASEMLECTQAASRAVFTGFMEPTLGGPNLERLMTIDPGGASAILIAEQGTLAPGQGGRIFNSFRQPVIDGCALPLFDANVSGSKTFWRQQLSDGALVKLFENSVTVLPGGPASWQLGGATRPFGLPAERRTVLYLRDIEDVVNSSSHSGIWEISEGGAYACIAYQGSGGGCRVTSSGRVHPPSFSASTYAYSISDPALKYVIDDGIVPLEFDPIAIGPDPGALGSFGQPVICPKDGLVYAGGTYQSPSETSLGGVVLRTDGATTTVLARVNDLPGVDLTFGSLTQVSVSMSATCQLLVHAQNSLVRGLWIQDPDGAWVKLMQTGDTIELAGTTQIVDFVHAVSGGNGYDHRPQAIDSNGGIAFRVVTIEGDAAVLYAELVGK